MTEKYVIRWKMSEHFGREEIYWKVLFVKNFLKNIKSIILIPMFSNFNRSLYFHDTLRYFLENFTKYMNKKVLQEN